MVNPHQDTVELNHSFEEAYVWLDRRGPSILTTGAGTRFEAFATKGQKDEHLDEPVIKFFQNGKEFGRSYACCWGHYYNCSCTRIGMYCKAVDKAILEGSADSDSIKEKFPIIESYRNAAGKTIEFSVNLEDLSTGWTATATETDKSKGKRIGYHFHVCSSTPNEALWKIRTKIRKNLATKYLDETEGETTLTHDEIVGRITSSDKGETVLEVDGKEVDAEKFWKILSAYEGSEISIVIREQ
jgi:hypothetical protein